MGENPRKLREGGVIFTLSSAIFGLAKRKRESLGGRSAEEEKARV